MMHLQRWKIEVDIYNVIRTLMRELFKIICLQNVSKTYLVPIIHFVNTRGFCMNVLDNNCTTLVLFVIVVLDKLPILLQLC